MGKSRGAKQDVTEYQMSIHLAVGMELDSVNKIIVDEKVAWQGTAASNTTLNINRPDLFGGHTKEGGLVGSIDVLLGRSDQVLPATVADRYGKTPSTCPAFRGITTLFFRGSTQISTGRANGWEFLDLSWLDVAAARGFIWKHNNPYIAQKIAVEGTRAPKGLNPAFAMIGPNANPAHIIYECLVNDDWGMAGSPDLIDKDGSFEAVAETLHGEDFGLSVWWMRQGKIEDFIGEILDHIQATIYVDPTTGLLSIKLIRDDYDVESLPRITPDNAKLSNYKIRSSGEIVNEITGTWTNPENEQEESVTVQDIASINSQNGERISASRPYYAVRDAELLRKLIERDLRASTAPLISADVTLDRSLWNVLPGQVAVLSWPRRNINDVVVRLGKTNYGKPGDSSIKVSVVQDIFSLSRPPIPVPAETEWVDPSATPMPLTMQLTTLPSYFARNGELNRNGPIALGESEVLVAALADSESVDSLDFALVSESVGPGGETIVVPKGSLTLTPLATLAAALDAEAESELPAALFPDLNEAPVVGGFVFLGYGDADQEIALVTERTDTGWTIARGVLDTVPQAWTIGTPAWAVNPGARIVDEQTLHAAGDDVTYRGLDRTTQGEYPYADADDVTATLTERPHLPLRPANVTVGGVAFGEYDIADDAETTFEVSWATRNRLLEDSAVMLWTDGPVTPEYRQETVVRVYDAVTDDLIVEHAHLWLDNSIVFTKANFNRYSSIAVEVISRRDDLESLAGHRLVASGFANNPAAAAPAAPAARTPPPPPVAAPAADAFVGVAVTHNGPNNVQLFTIDVAGTQDRLDVEALIVFYRVTGESEWVSLPAVTLNGEAVVVTVPSLVAATSYDLAVAYVENGIVGQLRVLSDVTTGASVPIGDGDLDTTPPADVTGTPTLSIATTLSKDGTEVSHLTTGCVAVSGAAGYDVEINDGTTTWVEWSPTNSLKNLRVVSGKTYKTRWKAMGRTGLRSANWSSWSANVVANGKTTAPPAIVSGSATAIGGRRIRVVQKRPVMTDYSHTHIYRNTTGFSPDDVPQSPYTSISDEEFVDVNVTVGTNYRYWGRTVDRSENEADTATFLGNAAPVFTSVAGGDVSPTDPLIVNTEIDINTRTGVITGIGDGNNTPVANLQAAFAPRRTFSFLTSVEGCTANDATLTWNAGGTVTMEASTADPVLFLPALDLPGYLMKKIRMRLRAITVSSPLWEGGVYYTTSGHGLSTSYYLSTPDPAFVLNEWVIVEWDTVNTGGGSVTDWVDSTIQTIRFDLGAASNADFEIDWIAFGSDAVDQVDVRDIEDGADVTLTHVADSVTGQGDLALLDTVGWGSGLLTGRPTELTDGRVWMGLDASGDLNRNLTVGRLNASDVLRWSGGGEFIGELAADVTLTHVADSVVGQGDLALLDTVGWGSLITGRPANLSALSGSEGIQNTLVVINPNTGAITGIGTGTGTQVANLQAAFAPRRAYGFTSGTDGFSCLGATISQANGVLTLTSTTTDPILWAPSLGLPGRQIRKVRVRLRPLAASPTWEGNIYYSTGGHSESGSYYKNIANPGLVQNQWVIVEWDMSAVDGGGSATDWLDSTIYVVRFDFGTTSGEAFEIDWIAFGDTALDPVGVRSIEDGADVTLTHVADSVVGQGDWATSDIPTTHLTRPGSNILFNGGFRLGQQGWVYGSVYTPDPVLGPYIEIPGNGGLTASRYPCAANQWFILSAEAIADAANGHKIYLVFWDAGGSYVGEGSQAAQNATLSWVRDAGAPVFSPTGTASYSIHSYAPVAISGIWRVRKIKVEAGIVATPWSDEATNGALYRSGATIDSLEPDEAGADVTLTHVADSVVGQGDLALLDNVGWGSGLLTDRPANLAALAGTEPIRNIDAAFAPRRGWDFNASDEGFSGSGVTITHYAHGIIAVASTSGDPILWTPNFVLRGSTIRRVRMRLRPITSVTWEGSIFWASTTLGYDSARRVDASAPPSFTLNQWSIIEWDMTGPGGGDDYTEGTVIQLRFDLSATSGTWEIDWIAMGSEAVDQVGVRGIDDNADVTGDNVADSIEGQGDLALLDAVGAAQIESGAVTAAKLGTDAVTTAKVQAGSITPDFYENTVGAVLWTAESTEKTVQTKVATVVRGKVRITALVDVVGFGFSSAAQHGILRLKRDGTERFDAQRLVYAGGSTSTWRMVPQIMLDYLDDPGAGTFTYTLTFQPSEATDGQVLRRSLFIQPLQG